MGTKKDDSGTIPESSFGKNRLGYFFKSLLRGSQIIVGGLCGQNVRLRTNCPRDWLLTGLVGSTLVLNKNRRYKLCSWRRRLWKFVSMSPLTNFPILERIEVIATWTGPCAFLRIGVNKVIHFHNQPTLKTQGRFTVNFFGIADFLFSSHYSLLFFTENYSSIRTKLE